MQSHTLWTHITLQDSSLIDKSKDPNARGFSRTKNAFMDCLKAPNRLFLSTVQILGYLKRCHRAHVIALDLSFVPLDEEVGQTSFETKD